MQPGPRAGRGRQRALPWRAFGWMAAAVLVMGVAVGLLWRRSRSSRSARPVSPVQPVTEVASTGARPPSTPLPSSAERLPSAQPEVGPPSEVEPDEDAPLAVWEQRLARARTTLSAYLQSTRYPPGSRPMRENLDLVLPYRGVAQAAPLVAADGTRESGSLDIDQDAYNLVGEERAHLFISCSRAADGDPCVLEGGEARALVEPAAGRIRPVPVAFGDRGEAGDKQAGDGIFTAEVAPAASGFTGYNGQIGVVVAARIGSRLFPVRFSLMYTSSPPAVFTGKVRESLEQGALVLRVELEVTRGGRYLVNGRLDDRDGQTFAFLAFNDVLEAGRREVALELFGKLALDSQALSPYRLRDLDGLRLIEGGDPDRELMHELPGVVHTTRQLALSAFSDAVWDSEQKQRYTEEFTADVARASERVRELGGTP